MSKEIEDAIAERARTQAAYEKLRDERQDIERRIAAASAAAEDAARALRLLIERHVTEQTVRTKKMLEASR